MTASEVLQRALGILQESGWHQCAQYNLYDGPLTVSDAIFRATEPGPQLSEAKLLFRKVIGRHYISAWNNASGRTYQEIEDALSAAIKLGRVPWQCDCGANDCPAVQFLNDHIRPYFGWEPVE